MIGTDCSPSFVGASGYEAGNRAAALLRRSRPCSGVLGGALALLAFAVLALAVPSKAQADVLVSNLNQGASDGGNRSGGGSQFQQMGTDDLAQGFMTGTNADGYTLTSIEMLFASDISAADIGDLTVSIHADDGSDNPAATALFALEKPASITGILRIGESGRQPGTHTFTVPAANTATTFTTSTSYFVVLTYDQQAGLWYHEGDSQDGGAAAGWTITDPLYKRGSGSWTADEFTTPKLIRVNGVVVGGVTNALPMAANNTVTINEDVTYNFEADDFGFVDADTGDTLASVKIVTLPAEGTLTFDNTVVTTGQVVTEAGIGNGELQFTPAANANGDDYASFTFKVNDGTDDSADAYTMTVDVTAANDPPTAADKTVTTDEDTAYTFDADDFGFVDVDTGDTLASVKIVTLPAAGELALDGTAVTTDLVVTKAEIDTDDLTFTPVTGASGTNYASFTFTVNDGTDDSASANTMTVDVTAAMNAAPTAANNTVTTAEDTAYAFEADDFGFTDTDVGNTLVSVKIVTLPLAGTLELVDTGVNVDQVVTRADIDNDNLIFTPAANANGDAYASFTFTVNDGTDDSASANTMTVDVTAANDPPTGLPTITGTAQVGEELTAATTGIADADGLTSPTYAYQWVRLDADGTSNAADITDADAVTYTLTSTDVGKTIKVEVSFDDDTGTTETLTSAVFPSSGTVTAAPTAPVVVEDGVNVTSMAESDDTYGTGEKIEFTVTFDQAVTVTGTPEFEFCLGSSGTGSCTEGDPPPTRRRAPFESGSGTTMLVFSYTVIAGDVDDNGIWIGNQDRTIKLGTATIQGTVGGLDAVLTHAEVGSDGHMVNGETNAAPTAANNTVTTNEDTAYTFEADDFGFADANAGDSLASVKIVTLPLAGTLELVDQAVVVDQVVTRADIDNETLIFTPAANANGDAYASFTFTVNDGTVDSADANTMTVDVTAANDSPTGLPTITGTAQVDEVLTADTTGIADADGLTSPTYMYQWVRLDADGTSNAADISGEIAATYTLTVTDEGKTIKVRVTFDDDTGTTETLTSAVYPSSGTVGNAAPTAADRTVTTAADTAYAFIAADFRFADSDVGDTLASVRIVTLPAAGTLALDGTAVIVDQVVTRARIDAGDLTFTPVTGQSGAAYGSFTFKVNDGTVDSASAYTMTVDVNNPVTGLPTITGTTQVGETLTAVTTDIADADGLDRDRFSYHWSRYDADGTNGVIISGTNAATYALTHDDLGKRLRVLVLFRDGGGTWESVRSDLTDTVVARPVVTLELTPSSISENGGMSTVTASLDRPLSQSTTVTVSAAAQMPAVAGDFRLTGNTTLTIAAGQTTSAGTVRITAVNNDVEAAADKTVTVSGVATDGVTGPQAVELTIEDDEQASTEVTLTVSPDSISEGATGRRVTVTAALNRAVRETATEVEVTVTADTATEGEDFAAVSDFTVTIPAERKSGSATFTLEPVDDSIDEPDETVRVTGSLSGSGLTLQPSGGLTVTIEDNEPKPKVTLVLMPDSIREDGGETTVTATLDSPSTEVTTITVTATPVAPAVAGDFRLIGATLRIPPGMTESTGTATIEAVDNDVEAPNKRVTVSAAAQNAFGVEDPPDRTLTITDNEVPSTAVTLSVSPSDIREGDSQTVTVTAELDGAARTGETQIAITVGAGTAATTDFQPVTGFTVIIPPEAKSGSADFTLNTVQDETDEPDETVRVTGRTPGLRTMPSGGVTVTIVDDDPSPVVTLVLTPDSIREDGGSSTVTASLDRPSSASTVVTITAAAQTPSVAGDFRLRGTRLTIPAGQTVSAGTVRITAVNNDVESADKTVTVSGVAANADGVTGPQAVDLTIADDEQPSTEVTLTVSPDNISEGATGNARRVTVTAALNRAARETVTAVAMTVTAGTATQGEDFAAVSDFTVTIPIGQKSGTAQHSFWRYSMTSSTSRTRRCG